MRTRLVAGNWKMNLNQTQSRDLALAVAAGLKAAPAKATVVLCPPAVYIPAVIEACRGTSIATGAQDLYHESAGAFTGEISAAMVADIGAKYAILGHSERRHTIGHHEDDRMINLKLRATQAAGLTPILCLGETLAERDANQTLDVLTFQLTADIVNARIQSPADLVIAYEPVWAIGTGRNATPEQAQEAHRHLRTELRRLAGAIADQIPILYGGSVKPDNAKVLFSQPDVDGGLIGGASLKADSFLGIIAAAG